MDLNIKFSDFDSKERCLVLDLDSRYDLILEMAWLEGHEPWINWRSKILGATRIAPSGALVSHEPTSAMQQKRFWRGHWTESVNVLDIEVSEMDDDGLTEESHRPSLKANRMGRNPLNVGNDMGLVPEPWVSDTLEADRVDSDPPNVCNDMGLKPGP